MSEMAPDLWALRNKRSSLDTVESLICNEERRLSLGLSLDYLHKYRSGLLKDILSIQLRFWRKD
jgi:hypothetical protein